jgi:hypothetical protein
LGENEHSKRHFYDNDPVPAESNFFLMFANLLLLFGIPLGSSLYFEEDIPIMLPMIPRTILIDKIINTKSCIMTWKGGKGMNGSGPDR